jgi:hypothetical protein
MIKILTILIFVATVLVEVRSDDRRDLLVGIINEELSEMSRLSKQINHNDPNLLLRLAELNLEKARLLKENENDKYLKLSPGARRKTNREKFFSDSRNHFLKSQRLGEAIVGKYKNFKKKGTVYYVLAFNAKEFNKIQQAKKFFKLAIDNSKVGSEEHLRSKLSLAEIEYNEGEFKNAIPLYESSLAKKWEKWWTKDAHNLAWSYYRTKQYEKAVGLLKEVIETSKNKNFIDMTDSSLRDLALFYAGSGQTEKAVSYYKKIGSDPTEKLLQLAKHLIDQEKFVAAEDVLEEAGNRAVKFDDKVEIGLLKLRLFEKYAKYEKHYEVCEQLVALNAQQNLDDTSKSFLIYQIKKNGAVLQRQVVGDTYKDVESTKEAKGKLAANYFSLLGTIEGDKGYQSYLHSAETFFAIKNFDAAVEFYQKAYDALELSKVEDKRKFQVRSVVGMLDALGQKVSQKTSDQYLLPAYVRYLKLDSESKRANLIYQKTFNLYFDKKQIDNAEKILIEFKDNHPNDLKTQEAMLAQIMDHYKNLKDDQKVRSYISRINNGEFQVSKKYVNGLKQYLLNLQFEDVEKASATGDKTRALRGYSLIYLDPKSSSEAKMNAAYNLTVLFHELQIPEKTKEWLEKSLRLLDDASLIKFENSLFVIITELFHRRFIKESSQYFSQVYNRLCGLNSKKKDLFFINTVILSLANADDKSAVAATNKGFQCQIDKKYSNDAKIEIVSYYLDHGKFDALKNYLNIIQSEIELHPHLIIANFKLADVHRSNGRAELASEHVQNAFSLYRSSLKYKFEIPVEALDLIANEEIKKLEKTVSSLYSIKLTFPEETYNKVLKEKLKILDLIAQQGVEVIKIKSGKGIVAAYQLMVEAYQRFAYEVENFVPPQKSQDYVLSFQNAMKKLTGPIVNESKKFLSEARSQISRNKILSEKNFWFSNQVRLPVALEYRYFKKGILMDRGGKQ